MIKRNQMLFHILIVLLLSVSFISLGNSNNPVFTEIKLDGLTKSEFISISGDADFATQAAKNGWDGVEGSRNGSYKFPYLISNLQIEGDILYGIQINNTRSHFVLSNIWVNGGGSMKFGIELNNVSNGIIENSQIDGLIDNATFIKLVNCSRLEINNNKLQGIGVEAFGLSMFQSYFVEVRSNYISHQTRGIYIYESNANIFEFNVIDQTSANGIQLTLSISNEFNTNILRNGYRGFSVKESDLNAFSNNIIEGNSLVGINLWYNCIQNILLNNTITDSGEQGILIQGSESTFIFGNTISGSSTHGLSIDEFSSKYFIISNNFISNEGYMSQAEILNKTNTLLVVNQNHWDDHLSPNIDGDSFVDASYEVYNPIQNLLDHQPLIEPFLSTGMEFIDLPVEPINETIKISWTPLINSLGYTTSYNVRLTSRDPMGGQKIDEEIALGVETTSIEFNSTQFPNRDNYRLRISAVLEGPPGEPFTSFGSVYITPYSQKFTIENVIPDFIPTTSVASSSSQHVSTPTNTNTAKNEVPGGQAPPELPFSSFQVIWLAVIFTSMLRSFVLKSRSRPSDLVEVRIRRKML